MKRPHSLQSRLLALVLGVVVAVWLVTAAMTWLDVRHELDELLDSHLAQAAALLVVQQTGEIEDDDHAIDAPTLHRYAPKVAFQVFHDGRLALRSANAPATPMVADGERADAGFRTGFRTVQIDGLAWRVFAAHGGERDVQVYVGEQEASRSSILLAVLRGTLAPMLLALPLLALAAWWAVYRGMAPLRQLGSTLAARQPHALQPVTLADAPTEMAADAGGAERAVRSHRCPDGGRAPLHRRCGTRAAHADRGHPGAGPGGAGRGRRRAAPPCARGHAGGLRPRRAAGRPAADAVAAGGRRRAGAAALDLGALVRKVVAELAPQALQKPQTVELDAADACTVQGDATLLAVLVRNLVDNAIRYSPLHATVRMAVVAAWQPGTADGRGQRRRHVRGRQAAPRRALLSRARQRREAAAAWAGRSSSASPAASGAAVRVGRSGALGGLSVEVGWPLAR